MCRVIMMCVILSLCAAGICPGECEFPLEDLRFTYEPELGAAELNREFYHASFVDGSGWLYLGGDTQWALGVETFAVVLEDVDGRLCCAYLGTTLADTTLGENVLIDPGLNIWGGLDPYLDHYEESKVDGQRRMVEQCTDNMREGTASARFSALENDQSMFNIHQDHLDLNEGAYYRAQCYYNRLTVDVSTNNPRLALETMSYHVDWVDLNDIDNDWDNMLSGGACFYKHNELTPGHEITIPLTESVIGAEVLVDDLALQQVFDKAGGTAVSSLSGDSNRMWLILAPNFKYNFIAYIYIYVVN